MLIRTFILIALVHLFSSPYAVTCRADDTESKPETTGFPNVYQKFTGDIDQMAKKRLIRVLMPYSKTFFFFDGAQPRGASYDLVKKFETFVNKRFKTKTLKIHVLVIPTARKDLIPFLANGKGDLAIGNLTITEKRLAQVAFSSPMAKNVSEILVSGSKEKSLNSIFDLAGKKIHAR